MELKAIVFGVMKLKITMFNILKLKVTKMKVIEFIVHGEHHLGHEVCLEVKKNGSYFAHEEAWNVNMESRLYTIKMEINEP
jgi:hypothetical protein